MELWLEEIICATNFYCNKLLFKKVIFQTHQVSAHDGNQYINPIKEDPDGVEGEPVKELRQQR